MAARRAFSTATLVATVILLLAACGSGSSGSSGGGASASPGHPKVGTALIHTPGPRPTPAVKGSLPDSSLSAADIQATLDAHNAWRTKSSEALLTWDANLAALAQDWSSQMAKSGSLDHRPNNNEGENIFAGTGTYTPKAVVDSWGSEESNYHAASNTCDADQQCGHYTQLVWATTSRVGCGTATSSDGTVYWTCNYDPPGNLTGVSPFDAAAQQTAGQ